MSRSHQLPSCSNVEAAAGSSLHTRFVWLCYPDDISMVEFQKHTLIAVANGSPCVVPSSVNIGHLLEGVSYYGKH